MLLHHLSVQNYKSLRDFKLEPGNMTVLIGANAAGKSNVADLLDFLSEIYRHGLEIAVARKGGYENIAYRRASRAKSGIDIRLKADFTPDLRAPWVSKDAAMLLARRQFRVQQEFTLGVKGASIAAEFRVQREVFILSVLHQDRWEDLITLLRTEREITVRAPEDRAKNLLPELHQKGYLRYILPLAELNAWAADLHEIVDPTELASSQVARFATLLRTFTQAMAAIRVFQIAPNKSREFGVPTPTPQLERSGANLPAVIHALQRRNPEVWHKVFKAMRSVVPGLTEISVAYTTSRTLGLFFHEQTIGRPWTVDEISDGTLQTLCLLVAIFDPATVLLVIEEPENSVHPWIIRNILDACAEASAEKQVIITTHSPIIINHTAPSAVWVLWRSDAETHAQRLIALDPGFTRRWESGEIATFDYLNTGVLTQAVPPAFNPHGRQVR